MNFSAFARDNLSLIILAAVALLTLFLARDYLFIAVFALSIAVVCMPLHRRLIQKMPAWVSAGTITTIITGAVVGIGIAVVVVLLSDIEYLLSILRVMADTGFRILGSSGGDAAAGDLVSSLGSMITAAFPKLVITLAELVPALIIDIILFYALLYSFIVLGDRIWGDIWSVLPESSRENVALMASKTKDILYSLYIVHVIISILTFFLAYGFFLMLGYGHEMFYAMLCAVFALIPFLGPILILIFVGLYALCIGDWRGVVLICTVGYFLICVVTDIILRPKLTGKRVQIRPMLMFVGFFGGAMTMGLLGFVLGPVLLVLGITGYEIFFKEMRRMKTSKPADAS
ncbi:MAG: AI-2E family transporter [Methanocorpusculum sp.]|nr:AI-2E family transporter [Methanocorpusculum sp.]MDE2522069.1 AI-2E family transporter [Methanocorpusculum sp.]MDE2524566.1 AI-2E family transporter [Methanocorpusculum sp.]